MTSLFSQYSIYKSHVHAQIPPMFLLLYLKKKEKKNKVALVCSTSKRCQHIQDVVAYVLCPFLAVGIYIYIRIKKMSKLKKKHVANSSVL